MLLCTPTSADASITRGQREFFEKKVRPLLIKRCYECHSEQGKVKGGLRLDSKAGWMMGGDSGPAIEPGELENSLIIAAIQYHDEDTQMPPKGKLPDHEIKVLVDWVKAGAPDPRGDKSLAPTKRVIDVSEGKNFWAFVPPKEPAKPTNLKNFWARGAIDMHVQAALQAKGIQPVHDADRTTLIRRATFDLIGLPPTPAEIDAFVKDNKPIKVAFAKVIDRLLASPRFGERWGRHWLDVARYGESAGRTRNYPYPAAWRYRDYVIDAVNRDIAFDRFLKEQIAGDLLPSKDTKERDRMRIATGYLAVGSKDLNERNPKQYQADNVDEQIDVISRSVMALTVACARCHDHKFDPIAQSDYYALAGIFQSTSIMDGYKSRQGGGNRKSSGSLYALGSDQEAKVVDVANLKQLLRNTQNRIKYLRKDHGKKVKTDPKIRKEYENLANRVKSLNSQIKAAGKNGGQPKGPIAMGVRDTTAVDARIAIKGELDKLGDRVPRGMIRVVSPHMEQPISKKSSGRMELVNWLTSESNPLTARVMVNRIWHHLFGHGIVRTVDNFGETGERPSNPKLLDHLAVRFMENGWSVKKMIREIMLSRTYGLSTAYDEAMFAKDPDNRLFWRQGLRRLQVEAIRDAMLAVSGELDLEPMVASPVAKAKNGEIGRQVSVSTSIGNKRSVYMPIIRNYVSPTLELFDFAEPTMVRGRRNITTVAPQALFMMNSPFVLKRAEQLALRVRRERSDASDRIELAYRLTLGRACRSDERERALSYLQQFDGPDSAAFAAFCQTLLASAEFRYLN